MERRGNWEIGYSGRYVVYSNPYVGKHLAPRGGVILKGFEGFKGGTQRIRKFDQFKGGNPLILGGELA